MKPLSIAVAILATIMALSACKYRKDEPVPGPKATSPAATETVAPASEHPSPETRETGSPPDSDRRHGANGISFFQGTLEEAFSTTCGKCTAMFLRDALDR